MTARAIPAQMRDCYAKFIRALDHFAQLSRVVLSAEAGISYEVESGGNGTYICRVRGLQEPSRQVGLLAGDCAHNARTALDHLVSRLAEMHTGIPAKEQRKSAFPVLAQPRQWQQAVRRDLAGVSESVSQRIWELQPFNYDNATIWGELAPNLLPYCLTQLSELDNVDKHRAIHAAWHCVPLLDVRLPELPPGGRLEEHRFTARLEADGWLASWRIEPADESWKPDLVDVRRSLPVRIGLEEPSWGEFVLAVLDKHLKAVAGVLELFRPVFEGKAEPDPVPTTAEIFDRPDYIFTLLSRRLRQSALKRPKQRRVP